MKRKTILFISILQLLVITGCYDDLGNYGYTNSTKVSFVNSASSDYTFMVGDLFEMDAPVNFSTDIGNVDELFTVQWYLNRELIYTGYHLKYQFEKGGTYELILKVINKETNETYISNKYTLTGKNSFDWGWMILSNKGDGKSSLSFINPGLRATHDVENIIEECAEHHRRWFRYRSAGNLLLLCIRLYLRFLRFGLTESPDKSG